MLGESRSKVYGCSLQPAPETQDGTYWQYVNASGSQGRGLTSGKNCRQASASTLARIPLQPQLQDVLDALPQPALPEDDLPDNGSVDAVLDAYEGVDLTLASVGSCSPSYISTSPTGINFWRPYTLRISNRISSALRLLRS